MKQVVILAGGKGTRLRSRIGELPKPLVEIGGVPLLEHQILLAKRHGFTRALVLVNHGAQRIAEYCASKGNWGLELACVHDGEARGTAGATLAAFDRLAAEFLVMYGDTMLDVNLTRFHAAHAAASGAAATLLLHPNDHPQDSDLVEIDDDGRVTAFHPYPHPPERYYPNLVNAALYWINRESLAPWRGERGMLDFGRDLFPAMLGQGLALRGFRSSEYIKDVGTPSRLDAVCADSRSGKIARASLDRPQAMVFIDRDGTINREVEHLSHPGQLELLPGAAEAIKRLNASDYRCSIVTNQPVVARGDCTLEGLREIHNKLETLLGAAGAFVDRIYHCPHHPDRGFPGERAEFKIDCDCRKPKTGMVERAVREFNVERERSWLIGDASIDVETARRAGLKSVLVETGCAGLDYRAWAIPDATVPGLPQAVSYILECYPRMLRHCATLAENVRQGALVLIGGQARTGKSTFASVLRDAIAARGLRCVVLSADRWLKSAGERGRGVLERFDMPQLQALVAGLCETSRPPALSLPAYHKLRRERIDAVESVSLRSSDVVVLEGIVALAVRTPSATEVHRFHVEIEEDERQRRVLREYRLRGLPDAEALQIYLERREDEFPVVERLARDARRVRLSHDH